MKVKVIATGSSKWDRFTGRWGVSFLVGEDLLFDSFGDAKAFFGNMRKFGVDISKIKHVVLSHDHWDHISGAWDLIAGRRDITVYICPGSGREVKERIVCSGVRIVECGRFTAIEGGIFSTGQIQQTVSSGNHIPEQALVLKTAAGVTVVTGCAHPGITNIVNAAKGYFTEDKISCVLGGFHLKDNSKELNASIIGSLRDSGVCRVAPTHCTGREATNMMRRVFGGSFIKISEGQDLEL